MASTTENTRELLNDLGGRRIPFLLIIDFEGEKPVVIPESELPGKDILFSLNGKTNAPHEETTSNMDFSFEKYPIPFDQYEKSFKHVQACQNEGDSYLLNLTFPTKIKTDLSLNEIFFRSSARYKLLYKNEFVFFSPECFIRIEGNRLYSYPMKGTIDAAVENAESVILGDEKELAEHITIVDLIRNDLSRSVGNSNVEKFRYLENIQTNDKELIQVSSRISAELPDNFYGNIGDIIFNMLPAGSVSGAPKKRTMEIIGEAEQGNRGYYTGICGYFDGTCFDSAVMIRYIEVDNGEMYYHSGGGITVYSEAEKEYMEMIDKVYVPIA